MSLFAPAFGYTTLGQYISRVAMKDGCCTKQEASVENRKHRETIQE